MGKRVFVEVGGACQPPAIAASLRNRNITPDGLGEFGGSIGRIGRTCTIENWYPSFEYFISLAPHLPLSRLCVLLASPLHLHRCLRFSSVGLPVRRATRCPCRQCWSALRSVR